MEVVFTIWFLCGAAYWLAVVHTKGFVWSDILCFPFIILLGPVLVLKHFLTE